MSCLKAWMPLDVQLGYNSQILVFPISWEYLIWNSWLLTIWIHGMKLVHASMVARQRIPLALPRGSRWMANINGTTSLTNVWICVPLLCWCMSCLKSGSQHCRKPTGKESVVQWDQDEGLRCHEVAIPRGGPGLSGVWKKKTGKTMQHLLQCAGFKPTIVFRSWDVKCFFACWQLWSLTMLFGYRIHRQANGWSFKKWKFWGGETATTTATTANSNSSKISILQYSCLWTFMSGVESLWIRLRQFTPPSGIIHLFIPSEKLDILHRLCWHHRLTMADHRIFWILLMCFCFAVVFFFRWVFQRNF